MPFPTPHVRHSGAPLLRAQRALPHTLWCVAGVCLAGCLDRPVAPLEPETTNQFVSRVTQTKIDKLDVLFMIDNSASMSDKQAILAEAVPAFVERLVNPACVDADGVAYPSLTPSPEVKECPVAPNGTVLRRPFAPLKDIHVGVVSSSLGGHGAKDVCKATDSLENVDMAHLVGSRRQTAGTNSHGFLAWDGSDQARFTADFRAMVEATGEDGCGFEASLESWYRFLIDPEPPLDVALVPCDRGQCLTPLTHPDGSVVVDGAILEQRSAFLRPDSLVAIVMLTDENDCSIQDGGLGWLATTRQHLPRSSSACESDPNSPCCYSCALETIPAGCPDKALEASCAAGPHDETSDPIGLRCWDQVRRFGVDLLYPTERYTNALTLPELCTARTDLDPSGGCPEGALHPNPLFADLQGLGRTSLGPDRVYLAGILGVPWQDVRATTPPKSQDSPSTPYLEDELHLQTAEQLRELGTWSLILDDGTGHPRDPLMFEHPFPRQGSHPQTLVPLQPPEAPRGAHPVNGHEYWNPEQIELQYACIFPLPDPIDCDAADGSCDCGARGVSNLNPLCQAPDHSYGSTQYFAKAQPSLRPLRVLRDFGDRSIVASICAKELGDSNRQDYGYNPAVDAIVDRLSDGFAGTCLPRPLAVDPESGSVPCRVLEVRPGAPSCDCQAWPSRSEADAKERAAVNERMMSAKLCRSPGDCASMCACRIDPVTAGPAQADCQDNEVTAPTTSGYCYIDAARGVGNPALVANCAPNQRQTLRFVGEGTVASGAQVFVTCLGEGVE